MDGTVREGAKQLGGSRAAFSRVLNARAAVSVETALALESVGWDSADFRVRMQGDFDLNWLRAGLRESSVPVNAAGGWPHNIEGEAYAVSPACFEAFAAGRGIAAATVRNRVVRLGRHRQRASPSGAANVFRAVLADGSRVKGMVFPGESVWDDDPPPRANASLVGTGR